MKFLIADKTPSVCEKLAVIIKQTKPEADFAGTANNEADVMQMIDDVCPDLVIFDITEFDGFSILCRARQQRPLCRFIATSGKRQFRIAYNAIKWQIDGLLIKPVDMVEFSEVLQRFEQDFAKDKAVISMNAGAENLLSNLFFNLARNKFSLRPLTIEQVNGSFRLALHYGVFCILHIRFDFVHHPAHDMELKTIQEKCLKIIRTNIKKYCYDILFGNEIFQCRGIINYPPEHEEQVRRALDLCLTEINRLLAGLAPVKATFGLSLPYRDLADTYQATMEAIEAVWLRFSKGVGGIIYWEKDQVLPMRYVQILEKHKRLLKKACALLDNKMFYLTLKDFFSLPKRILMCKETRTLLFEVEYYMYEINREYIEAFSDVEVIRKTIRDAHRKAGTLEEYLGCYLETLPSLFDQIIAHVSRNSKLVRQAQYFVEQNLNKAISLTDMGDQVGLNPVYFSYLFKKTTGKNFIDYVLACKIAAAKAYLVQKNRKISEVASLTGFSNAKYFARKFREKEGITPSEYQKLHG
jgi:two-component system response regulator YesN